MCYNHKSVVLRIWGQLFPVISVQISTNASRTMIFHFKGNCWYLCKDFQWYIICNFITWLVVAQTSKGTVRGALSEELAETLIYIIIVQCWHSQRSSFPLEVAGVCWITMWQEKGGLTFWPQLFFDWRRGRFWNRKGRYVVLNEELQSILHDTDGERSMIETE